MKKLVIFLILSLAASAQRTRTSQRSNPPTTRITSSQMAYTYALPADMPNVTLGVKDSSGVLIRTIFTGRYHNAGTYSGVWDGNNDAGAVATNGPFTITLLYGDPSFVWQGEVGATESSWVGMNRWQTFWIWMPLTRFAFVNSTGWTTNAYSEGRNNLGWFNDSDPLTPHQVNAQYYGGSGGIQFVDLTTDGQYLYAASNAVYPNAIPFVTKFDGITGQPAYFSDPSIALLTGNAPGAAAGPVNSFPGTTMSEIDIGTAGTPPPNGGPTSIAVQTGGNLLAVGHGNWWTSATSPAVSTINVGNTIKFFDKNTGLTVGSNATLENPISMSFDGSGNLWAISLHESWTPGGETASLNRIASPSSGNTVSQPITGLSFPVAVDVSKVSGHIYVLDGGTAQQLKEFDASFNLLRTYGQAGGYTDCNPMVTNNRLMIDAKAVLGYAGFIPGSTAGRPGWLPMVRVEPNGDVWFTHGFNQSGRLLHVTPSGTTYNYVNQVIYGTQTYHLGASHTQTNRLFIGWLEFQMDYTKQNVPGDPMAAGGSGMWKLVNDWSVGTSGACGSTDNVGVMNLHPSWINNVEQLSNGRVYASVWQNYSTSSYQNNNTIGVFNFELPTDGKSPARFAGKVPFSQITSFWQMDRNGNYRYATTTGSPVTSTTIAMYPLTGFDSSNNPTYGASQTIVTFTNTGNQQPYAQNTWNGQTTTNYEPTTAGVIPYQVWTAYNSSATTRYPHVGGVIPGKGVQFMVNPEVCYYGTRATGEFPCTGGTGNIGPGIVSEGHYVLSLYGAQASAAGPQYLLYYEDGMFIGTFGQSVNNNWTQLEFAPNGGVTSNGSPTVANYQYNATVGWQGAQIQRPGILQNSGAAKVLTVNGNLILHLMSESGNTPDQFWTISNLSSIHELAGTGPAGSSVLVNQPVF